jgi:hypothetical protein
MALAHSPSIVTTGLILCLDAGNPRSYPGSGTTCNDVSGNGNNGTLVNGVGFSSSDMGSLVFDGVDDFTNIANETIGNFGTSNFTVGCWGNATSVGDGSTRGIFSKYNPHSGNGTGWFMFYRDTSVWVRITQDLTAPLEASSIFATVATSKWCNIVMTRNDKLFSLYVNGILIQTNTTTNAIDVSSAAPLRIGSGYSSGYYYKGYANLPVIYNRALSAQEVTQNFNALRGRYGT